VGVGPRADRERYALVVGNTAAPLVMALDEWIVDEQMGGAPSSPGLMLATCV